MTDATKYSGTIKVRLAVAVPLGGSTIPRLTVTLTNYPYTELTVTPVVKTALITSPVESSITVNIPFSESPIDSIITFLSLYGISILSVNYYDNNWYLSTNFSDSLSDIVV